jgi:hypothetical protein
MQTFLPSDRRTISLGDVRRSEVASEARSAEKDQIEIASVPCDKLGLGRWSQRLIRRLFLLGGANEGSGQGEADVVDQGKGTEDSQEKGQHEKQVKEK